MKSDAIIGAVEGVTKKWAKQRKAEERASSARVNRRVRMTYSRRTTIKDAAYSYMEKAYLKASADGTLPAHARQIMYQARPTIQAETGQQLNDQYFCQTLLPDYVDEYGVTWDVVFDDRGHFQEPHTDRRIGLGTLAVRGYLRGVHKPRFTDVSISSPGVETHGAQGRFGAVLFVEKEGFMPLFEEVKLAERYDIAIMSTKGMSNTAARKLVDDLCGRHDLPLLVLHDFDKAGFSIVGTLSRNTRRYRFRNRVEVVDLGLRLDDVNALGLEPEDAFDRGSDWSKKQNLRKNGATDEEIEFLLHQRVELNALASDEMVKWIESKLDEHGVSKVIPDDDTLADAFKNWREQAVIQEQLERLLDELKADEDVEVPADLRDQISERLRASPARSWVHIVREIAGADSDDSDDEEDDE